MSVAVDLLSWLSWLPPERVHDVVLTASVAVAAFAGARFRAERRRQQETERELAIRVAERTAELETATAQYRFLAEHATDMVSTHALDGGFVYVSPSWSEFLGSAAGPLPGRTPQEFCHEDDRGAVADGHRRTLQATSTTTITWRCRNSAGEYRWLETTARPIRDPVTGFVTLFTCATRDITERKSIEEELRASREELRALSLVDELTGLHNRRGFVTLAEQQLKGPHRRRGTSLLFYFDVNDFKSINDRFGHAAGDTALRHVAQALRATFRETDIVARLGGDEFVALAVNAGDDPEIIEGRLCASLARTPNRAEDERVDATTDRQGSPLDLTVAVGIARLEKGSTQTLDELLAAADAALYEDKTGISRGELAVA